MRPRAEKEEAEARRRVVALAATATCVCVCVAVAVAVGAAAAVGGPAAVAGGAGVLAQHNAYRAFHGAPALVWDAGLAADAAAWVAGCVWGHLDPRLATEGENLYAVSGGADAADAALNQLAAPAWYAEGEAYDYGAPGFAEATGHFTQLVWVGTGRLGCAAAACASVAGIAPGVYVSCRYGPPGNVEGEFAANVLPPR